MPITKTMAYKVGDKVHASLRDAQIEEIKVLFSELFKDASEDQDIICNSILDHSEELIAVLTCKPEEEKPARKPRSDKGTKRIKEFTAEEVK